MPASVLIAQFNEANVYLEAADLAFSGIVIAEACLNGGVAVMKRSQFVNCSAGRGVQCSAVWWQCLLRAVGQLR